MRLNLVGIILVLATLSSPADASAGRVAGTYTATVDGQVAVLVLNKDGTGTLAGETGRWRTKATKIHLTDAEGTEIVGTVNGDVLEFSLEDGVLRFTRAKPFSPTLLAGKTVRPDDGDGSFRVPNKWNHAWGKGFDGNDAYTMGPEDGSIAVAVGRMQLSKSESEQPTESLLAQGLEELLSGVDFSREVEPESFLVGGRRGGRVVIRATIDGTSVEGYLGAVITKDWAYTVQAVYPVKSYKVGRAAANTVLATLRVKPPKPAPKASSNVAGCWRHKSATSGGGGKIVLRLRAAGTFTRFESSIIVGGGTSMSSSDTTDGRWSVSGKTLTLAPNGGRRTSSRYGLTKSGALVLGGKTYYRCK